MRPVTNAIEEGLPDPELEVGLCANWRHATALAHSKLEVRLGARRAHDAPVTHHVERVHGLSLVGDRQPVTIAEDCPAEQIVPRFCVIF